ncbi:CCR4-NOT transcription complex subunit 10 [Octopus sinensis]|uniref:CCR4-NOT transcription complex subunit 10 n=1 Tax=Octopus sinensis TaxID=2607531 RepID=A0A6P7SQD4_9MOLL|nr:CCR4-NOT transcription complex subunit 10 [Octopus sinensis]
MAECDELSNSNMSGLPVNDAQSELAKQAWQEFNKQQYDNCINILNKLLVNRSTDSKVIHNKAVAEFYQSKFTKVSEFKQSLATVCQLEHINIDSLSNLDDVDHSAVLYNQAVVLYHHRQYKAALSIMDKLFHYVEPLEENLTRKCLFLLVELYLQTHQPEKAMGMLSYIEKLLLHVTKCNNSPSGDKVDKNESLDSSVASELGTSELYRPKISLYKTRCLIMMKSLKACKREIKVLMSSQATNPSVVYLKSNFEYLRGSSRKVIKMLGTVPQNTVISESGNCLPVMYYNNLGCIHFNTRKHHLGAFYFRKAVAENESAVKNLKKSCDDPAKCGAPLQTVGMSRHHELLYNMGVQLLHCGMPQAAFDCLIQAVQVYQINPRLWLRLAECCIMNYRESNEDDKKLKRRMEVIQGSVASGVHRKLILGSTTKHVAPSHNPAIPAPSLEFAALCLRNALLLLPEHPHQSEVNEEHAEANKSDIFLVPAPPSNPMRAAEVSNLRCSILTASAYVSLCLNDHLIALNYTNSLLSQPRLSGAQRYLAHLYASEALVHLDRIADAIQHLNPEYSKDVSVCSQEQKSDQDKNDKVDKSDRDLADTTETKGALVPWMPAKPQKAQAVLLYNLAATLAISGEYSKALKHLGESSQLICQPFPAQMYCLKLYLDLIEGRRATAQYIIKESFGHVTPNRVDMSMMNKKSLASDQLLP